MHSGPQHLDKHVQLEEQLKKFGLRGILHAKIQKRERRGSSELSLKMSMLAQIPWLTYSAEWPVSSAIMEALSMQEAMLVIREVACLGSKLLERQLISLSSISRRTLSAVVARVPT